MRINLITKPLSAALRTLFATLTLLFVCPGVWGQEWVGIGNEADLRTQFNKTSGTTYIRLTADFNGNGLVVKSGNTIVLDLNGHTIAKYNYGESYDYVNTGFIIKVEAGATLTIQDNSETHLGAIKDGRMKGTGGGIWNLGIFNFQSGTITGNNCDSNSGNFGGGVYNGGTMEMSGGTISNNHVYYSGGGIYNAASATLTITGGTITGNDCYSGVGGGIYNDGTLTISGNPTITTNIRTYGGISANNVYLPSEKTITIGTGGLNGDAKNIGITMQTQGTFTTTTGATSAEDYTNAEDYTKFFSDDNHYEPVAVSTTDNRVALKSCWSLLDKQIAEATSGSTITLTKDYEAVSTDTYLSVPSGKTINIELAGHTLNRNTSAKADGCVIKNLGELTITDNSTGRTGAIYGGNNTNGAGGIHNDNEGTLHFNGGTIRNNASSHAGGGIYNAGTLDINGGTISNNSTTKLGAGIFNETGRTVTINSGTIQSNTNNGEHGGGIYNDGTLTINGGTISSNTVSIDSKHGGGIYNAGTLSVNGGTIQNNTVKSIGLGAGIYHDGTAFNLQGAPTISDNKYSNIQRNVYLKTGKKITITGDLTNATAIGVNMQTLGEFTIGLSSHTGTFTNFTSEAANTVRLTDYNADYAHKEAELITYWSYLYRQFSDPSVSNITLDAGSYVANNSIESYLYVPSTKTITLNLNSQTLNRNIGNTAKENGCVLFNEGTLTITGNGTITGGNNTGTGSGALGGGIYNTGTLEIQGGTIGGNRTSLKGGGIYNNGTLTINGGIVQGNTSSGVGRGIYNAAGKTMTLSSGSVRNNTGGVEHGGGIHNDGTLNMTGGTIRGNTITTTDKNGAGVYNNGTMTVSGGASIQSNWTVGNGGAIYNAGTLEISGGSITDNGIYVEGSTNLVRTVNGGGIYNAGSLAITGGTIQTNKATTNGGGIFNMGTISLSGAPTINNNYVGNPQNNIYLPEAHHIITITAALTNTTPIGIRMETPDVFTSGLSGNGTIDKFISNNGGEHKLVETGSEAALMTHWSYLQRRFDNATTNEVIALESGCSYTAGSNDTYLHVPSSKTFTLDLNGNTINRNITQNDESKKDNGCVIYNEGTLTITGSGIIRGGNNSDATVIKGGGICNTGTLTLESGAIRWNMAATSGSGIYHTGSALNIHGGTIQNNAVTSGNGGAIYHNGTTFNLQGAPYLSGNSANGTTNNVYLETGKTITITGKLTNSAAIGITSQDDHPKFTSGLHGWDDDATKLGDASKFAADQETHGIGLASNGEAIVGPKYNVTRTGVGDSYIYIHVKNVNANTTAVEGELVKVKIYGYGSSTIPINLSWTDGILSSYPDAGTEYEFVMPAKDVNITGECRYGGYCGSPTEADMKYYLKDGTLKFVTRDGNNYAMKNYATKEEVPWRGYSYSAVDISKVTTISDYAFYGSGLTSASVSADVTSIGTFAFGKCTSLTEIVVDGNNANYSSSDGVLYNKDASTLICYPAGKENLDYTLPESVTSIAEGAFAFGSYLQTITVAGGSYFKSVDGVLYNYAGTTLVYYPAGNNSVSYEVPTTATVGPYAFHNAKNLTHLFLLHNAVPTGSTAMFDESTFYIMVPSTLKTSYETTAPWNNYAARYRSIELTNDNQTTVVLQYQSIDCDGTPKTPEVTSVKKDNRTLIFDTDYTVSYSDNTEVGTATVTITGQGIYNGSTVTRNFTITRYVNFGTVTGQYVTYFASEDLNRPADVWNSSVLENNDGYWHPYRVYTITAINWASNSITIQPISSDEKGYIPKGMPILLYNMFFNEVASPIFHLTKYTGTATSVPPSSDFKGVSTSTSYSELIEDYADLYVLRNDKFVRATGGDLPTNKLPANRCYIARPTSVSPSSAPAYLSISGIDDNTTGITMEEGRGKTEELFSSDWYTINGVKLNGMPTKKGIYINNGRKVIIK